MSPFAKRALLSICLLAGSDPLGAAPQRMEAAEEKKLDKAPASPAARGPAAEQDYCSSVAKVTTAAKIAAQEAKLRDIETLVKRRAEELEAKRKELQAVVEKYEALTKKADDNLVMVYTKMKPDAAAGQFAMLDDDVAVALLSRLSPKISSQILSEMTASRGAGLIKKLAAYSMTNSPGKTQ
jgi:flagellar motility protein MotE (MotC chaperone)